MFYIEIVIHFKKNIEAKVTGNVFSGTLIFGERRYFKGRMFNWEESKAA